MNRKMQLKIPLMMILTTMFLLSACSANSGSLMIKTGQGEFKNKVRTDRTEIIARQDIGIYHLTAKHESLTSKADDNENISLVDGDRTSVGVGVHTDRGTDFTFFLSDDELWSLELMHRTDPVRWGLYPVLGITHLDSLNRSSGVKRKTTAAIIGIGYIVNDKTKCEATVTTRNNGSQFIDDYVLFGCGYKF